jgi:ADP-ribosylglycohydrolase
VDKEIIYDRVLGSLAMACIGDALGAPTEQRGIEEIRHLWGGRVEKFYAPPDDAPYGSGRKAGQITDDSSQLLYLADAYIEHNGQMSPRAMANALLRWADNGEYFPRFAGPTTRASVTRLRAGEDPEETGKIGRLTTEGTSNGAAMRVAPAGLAHPGNPEEAVRDALMTCLPSHATTLGVSGAAAVAAAVAVAMTPGVFFMDVIRAAQWGAAQGAQLGRKYGRDTGGPAVTRRLGVALDVAARARDLDEAIVHISETVGSGLHISEAVPAALAAFLAASGDPFQTVVISANLGDDTDTVACIAGSIAGAYTGFGGVPKSLYNQMIEANNLDLEAKARAFTDAIVVDTGS